MVKILRVLFCFCTIYGFNGFTSVQMGEEIEKSMQAFRALSSSLKFDENQFHACWQKNARTYKGGPVELGFYKDIKYIGSGGSAHIFQATSSQERGRLKEGQILALRVTQGNGRSAIALENCHKAVGPLLLSTLLSYSDIGPITEFFPDFFGTYYAERVPADKLPPKPKETVFTVQGWFDFVDKRCNFMIQEMTFVDTTYEGQFSRQNPIFDSVVFEHAWGVYAAKTLLRLNVGDLKWRNLGLKKVPYSRVYRLGEDIYRFDSELMPVRLDLDDLGGIYGSGYRFHFTEISAEDVETESSKSFLKQMKGEKDIFTAFSEHFSDYKITPEEADALDPETTHHFSIPQKIIDEERARPA